MARTLSKFAQEYLENLTNGNTEESDKLYEKVLKLRRLNHEAFVHCAYIVHSYLCPVDVAYLAFDICCKQIEANKSPNPQRIFQSLSRNQRASYQHVKPVYDDALRMLENLGVQNKKITKSEVDNTEIYKHMFTPKQEDVEFLNNYLIEKYFSSDNSEYYVVNTCIMPKSSWVLDVYATSFDDYCDIVQNTVKELNDTGTTLFLIKPEVFKKNIIKENPTIAYSIIVNNNFKFSNLSKQFVEYMDKGEEIKIEKDIKIANRIRLRFVSFIGSLYCDDVGEVSKTSEKYLSTFSNEEDILTIIEKLGEEQDIVKHQVELKTGIVHANHEIYKSILCQKKDIIQISSILNKIENAKLDFIIDSNKETLKILFIHVSHWDVVIDEINTQQIKAITDIEFLK